MENRNDNTKSLETIKALNMRVIKIVLKQQELKQRTKELFEKFAYSENVGDRDALISLGRQALVISIEVASTLTQSKGAIEQLVSYVGTDVVIYN